MKKIHFLFGVHNHQPVGNFDHVFEKGFACSYKPFISILEKHPLIKASMHFSGSLLEWVEKKDPKFIDTVQRLVEKKQVEIIGGGFYEPIFSILPERDIEGQLKMMDGFIEEKFNLKPKGCWLPERVWDPVMPRLISSTGLSYTLLDSTHFLHAGLSPEQVSGYFTSEREGKTISIFPIDMKLRYMIPFEKPEKIIEYLRYHASDVKDVAITYIDDGEKFGMWPGTYSWVYEKGWLEAFFCELEKNPEMIEMNTFSEYLSISPPEGRIYLPTVSYEEMMEWALPSDAVVRFEDMEEKLKELDLKDKYRPFIRGGYWNNFLVKYPESNQMHKKMLMISEKLETAEEELNGEKSDLVAAARKELYMGQCNCSYWHGLFGGIYLNYLRHAVYEHLINAEKIIDSLTHTDSAWLDYSVFDFRKDMSDELIVSGRNLNLYFSPKDGGSLFEFDVKAGSFNLLNMMTRRMEGYHRKLKIDELKELMPEDEGLPVSIHNLSKVKEEGLQNRLIYDWYPRNSFVDHFLGEGTTLDSFSMSRYSEIGNFVDGDYLLSEIKKIEKDAKLSFLLKKDGFVLQDVRNDANNEPIGVRKQFLIDDSLMEVSAKYTLENQSSRHLSLWFGVEINFSFLAADSPLHYCIFPDYNKEQFAINSKGEITNLSRFELIDEWSGIGIDMILPPGSDLWRFPIETVSQSEEGLERTYQGTTFLVHWKIALKPGDIQEKTVKICPYTFAGQKEKNISRC
jgi:alpha-amylase